jgi:hypothetical protein
MVRRVDPEIAQEMLWADLMALYREATEVGVEDGRRRSGAARFLAEIRKGRTEGRLVAAFDRLLAESTSGALLDDPRHPEALLEQRIVLASKPYSFLWSDATLHRAHRRVRLYARR